jgi:F-type H+-transporting ATPase subunit gamma
MTQTIEAMRRRIETAEDLYAVVRVMKALAAASIRQCERAVESLAEYGRTVEAGLQIVLMNERTGVTAEAPPGRHRGVVIFGSDQGMCGSFNDQVVTFALSPSGPLAAGDEPPTVLVVGARIVGRLEDAGCSVSRLFSLPSTVSGISPAVQEILLHIEELRLQKGLDHLLLVHHSPVAPAGSLPGTVQLLPVDRGWLKTLAERPWDSRSLPTFTMARQPLFSALIRQHLFLALYRAFAETLASENASRLASMQAAEKNIRDHLSHLAAHYHQGRQQSITAELQDIVAGFETLTQEVGRGRSGGGRRAS